MEDVIKKRKSKDYRHISSFVKLYFTNLDYENVILMLGR